jgi:hypothetical protein
MEKALAGLSAKFITNISDVSKKTFIFGMTLPENKPFLRVKTT